MFALTINADTGNYLLYTHARMYVWMVGLLDGLIYVYIDHC